MTGCPDRAARFIVVTRFPVFNLSTFTEFKELFNF